MTLKELEKRFPALEEYTGTLPENLRNQAVIRVHPAGTLIHQKNCELQYFGIIADGENRVINEFENGSIYLIETNKPIDFVGDVTLIAGLARTSVTIEAVTDSSVVYLPRREAERWLEQDNRIFRLIARHVAQKLYRSSYNNGLKLFYPPSYLLTDYIVKYCIQQGMRPSALPDGTLCTEQPADFPFSAPCSRIAPVQVTVRKTRQMLESELGINVKTLGRTIKALCEEGLFSMQKGKITVSEEQFLKCLEYLSAARGEG